MSRHAKRSGVYRWAWLSGIVAVVALILVVRPAWGSHPASPGRAAPVASATPVETTPAGATPTPGPTPKATPKPIPTPTKVTIPTSASGELAVVPGTAGPSGPGTPIRYRLQIERGLPFDGPALAAQVQRILTDPRGWQPIEGVAFARVQDGADFTLIVASPAMTDRLCAPLDTVGQLSCRNGDNVILNALRWATAVPWFHGDIDLYRAYQVNHEVGHRLGHGHAFCHGAGQPAPVMMQQSKGVGACRPNPWPAVKAD